MPKNLPKHDQRKFHFGFHVGYNNSSFQLVTKPNIADSIIGVNVIPRPGFNLAIPIEWNASRYIKVRFYPMYLTFQERSINYVIKPSIRDQDIYTINEKLESSYIQWPVQLKFRTDRVKNFAGYVLAGGTFGIDMASQKDVIPGAILKISKIDYGYDVGIGTDFFLEYVKIGLELKLNAGIPNVLIQENSFFSSPIQSLKTRAWMFTITIES
ncbi:MAG: hypothetical protein ACI9J3_001750 [Parvicellaceae bacterium]|jgi:hypothetical protein